MKAERRHELKTNTLQRTLEGLPAFAKTHANRLMMGLILILLVILALEYRANTNAKVAAQAQTDLASARGAINQLRNGSLVMATTQQAAQQRNALSVSADKAIGDVLMTTQSDPLMQARAQLARGDLYLTLSMFPELPGATTQPDLKLPRPRSEYSQLAEEAYKKVLDISQATPLVRNSARLGLAAVAENRSDWEQARKWYNDVIDDSEAGQALQTYALERTQTDFSATQPVLLASDEPAATEPATQPGAANPNIGSASPFIPPLEPNNLIETPAPSTRPAVAPASKQSPVRVAPFAPPATKPG